MPNVVQLYNLEAEIAYQRDGFNDAVRLLRGVFARQEFHSDGLTTVKNLLTDNTVTALKTSAGNLYLVHLNSPSGSTLASFIQFFNVAAGSVTLGTTVPREVIVVPSARSKTVVFFPGNDVNSSYSTAISYAVTTTATGNTAPAAADRPTLAFLYA